MSITGVLIAALIVGGTGVFIGVFLGIAGKKFAVEVDEKEEAILAELPGNNCGGCGYKTCRDHAIAIYNSISEINMCSPYMRQKAENIANLIFESSPFLIGLVDKEMNILEFNSNAKQFFDIKDDDYIGYPMFMYVDDAAFYDCLNNYKNIYNNIVPIEDMNKNANKVFHSINNVP